MLLGFRRFRAAGGGSDAPVFHCIESGRDAAAHCGVWAYVVLGATKQLSMQEVSQRMDGMNNVLLRPFSLARLWVGPLPPSPKALVRVCSVRLGDLSSRPVFDTIHEPLVHSMHFRLAWMPYPIPWTRASCLLAAYHAAFIWLYLSSFRRAQSVVGSTRSMWDPPANRIPSACDQLLRRSTRNSWVEQSRPASSIRRSLENCFLKQRR